ncbi:hypothetical protein Bca52824_084783 [Brassica carinata]|uniref:F-box/kelch-repeat protein n=1 Tax=Brassica carinata TaxID=52824 RepID=A0A8X7PP96_BRACI|nr:hypothetical protein Bca52824_084783 [Brassica carinata]
MTAQHDTHRIHLAISSTFFFKRKCSAVWKVEIIFHQSNKCPTSHRKHSSHHPPPPPSRSSLPEEIVLRCLAFVPRSYRLTQRLATRQELPICMFQNKYNDPTTVHWFTLRPNEETTTTEYVLVPNPTPFPPHKYGLDRHSGSKIFFIGGPRKPSSDLCGSDRRKVYVIGGGVSNKRFHEEIQVEVFDPKSGTWELAGWRTFTWWSPRRRVYNPRGCERERMVRMVNERLRGRKEGLDDTVCRACVVEDVFALLGVGLWFNTKFNAWSSLVGPDGKELFISRADAMSEYDDDGRLAVLYMLGENEVDETFTKSVEKICGTIDWSGVVGAVPYWFSFLHCRI